MRGTVVNDGPPPPRKYLSHADRARTVKCPVCAAEVGVNCVSHTGKRVPPHFPRITEGVKKADAKRT